MEMLSGASLANVLRVPSCETPLRIGNSASLAPEVPVTLALIESAWPGDAGGKASTFDASREGRRSALDYGVRRGIDDWSMGEGESNRIFALGVLDAEGERNFSAACVKGNGMRDLN